MYDIFEDSILTVSLFSGLPPPFLSARKTLAPIKERDTHVSQRARRVCSMLFACIIEVLSSMPQNPRRSDIEETLAQKLQQHLLQADRSVQGFSESYLRHDVSAACRQASILLFYHHGACLCFR